MYEFRIYIPDNREEGKRNKNAIAGVPYKLGKRVTAPSLVEALTAFLEWAREREAERYVLRLVVERVEPETGGRE